MDFSINDILNNNKNTPLDNPLPIPGYENISFCQSKETFVIFLDEYWEMTISQQSKFFADLSYNELIALAQTVLVLDTTRTTHPEINEEKFKFFFVDLTEVCKFIALKLLLG